MSCCSIVVFHSTGYISQTNERFSFLIHCSGGGEVKSQFGIITERIFRRQICTAPMLAECERKKLGKKKAKREKQMIWKTMATSRPLKRETYRTLLHDSLNQRCCLENWCEKRKSPNANHCRYIFQDT